MLAQNFKTPAELGILDEEFDALKKVLTALEREEIEYSLPRGAVEKQQLKYFNMGWADCQSVACIAGWAFYFSNGVAFKKIITGKNTFDSFDAIQPLPLRDLLLPTQHPYVSLDQIKPSQAAIALRNYLTYGKARWNEALAS